MIGRDVWVGAACYIVVLQPLSLQWPQNAQNTHVCLREENVVTHPTKKERACFKRG